MIRPVIPDPPSGYHLEEAILTTFDLDMDTLQNLIGADQDVEKFIIFRGDGDFNDSSTCETLQKQVVKIACPVLKNGLPEAFFHAKVWLFAYQNAFHDRKWHLIIHSVNIFLYNNLEAVLQFSGQDTGEVQPQTVPLCNFFSGLLPFISVEADDKRVRIQRLVHSLKKVSFTPCEMDTSDPLQRAMCSSKQFSFIGPSCGSVFLHQTYDEILVISPMITPARLSSLVDKVAPGGRCVVLTNAEMACKVLSDCSPNVCWLLPRSEDPFVHAKLFLFRRGNAWELYSGSMNLTDYAMDRNMEFMIRLEAPAIISIESFLATFTRRDEAKIAQELGQYAGNTAEVDSIVFQQASDIQMRIDYASHLLNRRKYNEEESKQMISFLLSSQCPAELARMLHDPDYPSIPLRKTVTVLQKEREVYVLPQKEKLLLGLINHALHQYDESFSQNVFLHIRNRKPTDVFTKIRKDAGFGDLYLFRTDIHAFDPSMDADVLSANIHQLFSFDASLCSFLDRMIYRQTYRLEPEGPVYMDGSAQPTGLPLCGFFENVYLHDFDHLMDRHAVFYARCGDDILVGAKTEAEIQSLAAVVKNAMEEKRLSLSETKTFFLQPGDPFVFLGWKITGNKIDFSDEALKKIRKSVYKESRRLLIRYKQSHIHPFLRLPLLIRYVNRSIRMSGILASFRTITVSDGLQQIDRMICDAIRTVTTGKTGNAKYRLSYETIQAYGYHSLVNRYYRWLSR